VSEPKPPEWLHDKHCLAHAIICAVENLRDDGHESDYTFRIALQNGDPLHMADEYLSDGTATCVCVPRVTCPEHGSRTIRYMGPDALTAACGCVLRDGIIVGRTADAN